MATKNYDKEYLGFNGFIWFMGVVEDILDPLKAGRVKVRCLEWHSENKQEVPTDDLPWAQVMMPVTSSGMSGIGDTPTGIKQGSWVVGFFLDGKYGQRTIVMGTIPGIPMTKIDADNKNLLDKIGFNDPEGKYPILIQQPDTNRLARNETGYVGHPFAKSDPKKDEPHPMIQIKNHLKANNITMALGGTWNEPNSQFAAVYPNNHVYETASGHIKEYDDTPNYERIHEYHAKGTFYEIANTGMKTTRIVANNYTIIAGSDFAYVKGSVNLTVDSSCKTYIKGNWDIQVDGNVSERIGGKYKRTVGGETHLSCSGDHKIDFNGDSYTRYDGDRHTHTGKDTYSRHDKGVDYSCPDDPPRTSDINCDDIDTAETT